MSSWELTRALLYRDLIWAAIGIVLFVVGFLVFTWLYKRENKRKA